MDEMMSEQDIKKSEFNAAVGQMIRISNLQQKINDIKINLLVYNDYYQSYNYQIYFMLCNSLLEECKPKLTDKEKDYGNYFRDKLTSVMDNNKVFKEVKLKVNGKKQIILDERVWNVLKKYLVDFESLVRKYLDLHDLNAPNKEYDEGWD